MKTLSLKTLLVCTGLGLSAAPGFALDLSKMPDQAILPEGTVKISEVVPGMGEHWANPKDLPLGPIYCVVEGKVVCLEFMVAQKDLAEGKSWPDLHGIKGMPEIDHMHMGFMPDGHEGYPIPHYDMHLYFLSPELMAEVK